MNAVPAKTPSILTPSPQELVAAGLKLVDDIAGRAADCEADGKVPDETVEAFKATGLHRDTHGAVVLGGSKVAEFQTIQKRVGEAAARIDAARLVASRDVEEAEAEACAEGKTMLDTRMRNRRTQSFMAYEAQTAMNLVFDAVGGRCLQQDHPIQRARRDVAAVNHHVNLNFDAVMSMYGQHRFGLPLVGQY